MSEWKYPQVLRVCNLWLKLYLSKVGAFTKKALFKICKKVDKLPADAFVEAMFYLNVCRTEIAMAEVELRFLKLFDELDINEISIICLSFFKTEKKIYTFELLEKLYDKTIKEIDNIEDISLVSILKTLRYSSGPPQANKMKQLCEALVPKVENYNLLGCLHISLLGTNLQYFNQDLIEKIVKRFNQDIKEIRLKDIERISFVLGLFDFKTESGIERELLGKIIVELKLRIDEILNHPRCFPSTAHYLSLCGIHDEEIIKSILKEDFIKFAYGEPTHLFLCSFNIQSVFFL